MKGLLLNEVLNSQRKDQHNFDWFFKDFGRVLFMSLGTSELGSTARVYSQFYVFVHMHMCVLVRMYAHVYRG